MKVCNNFDLFSNPKNYNNIIFNYDFLNVRCLENCSYIHYIGLNCSNGEIYSYPFVLDFSEVLDYILNNDCYIIAFNHCDNICIEVDYFG